MSSLVKLFLIHLSKNIIIALSIKAIVSTNFLEVSVLDMASSAFFFYSIRWIGESEGAWAGVAYIGGGLAGTLIGLYLSRYL